MTVDREQRLAVITAIAIAIITALGGYLLWRSHSLQYGNDYFLFGLFTATSTAYVIAGLMIIRRASVRIIGWLCLLTAAALLLSLTLTEYGIFAIGIRPGSLPSPGSALAFAQAMPFLTITGIILILHLFPTGRPLGPPWRVFMVITIVGEIVAFSQAILSPARITDIWSDELSHAGVSAANPFGIGAIAGLSDAIYIVISLLFVTGAAGAIASIIVRRRRGAPEERQQLRWLTFVAAASGVWILVMVPIMLLTGVDGLAGGIFWLVITPLVALGPPAAIGIGIVKYRLFDIDVVIRKALIVTIVAVALTSLYLAVLALATVSGISRVVVGIALLAVTFNPVRRAARSIADRVAYGRRATSYEVVTEFSERMAGAYATDDVLPRMAAILAGGTGARSATVWLHLGDRMVPAATSGDDIPVESAVPVVGDALPALPGDATEVRQRDELLGAFSVSMPENDPLDPARERLIRDLASQAGLVLRNVRLIEELRGSRQRLVSAQDEERRKIERNLHDGVQQQLVALNVQLGLLARVAESDPSKAGDMAAALQSRAVETLEDLRDLARGIYPPLLADRGLPAALETQARKAALPVTVEANGIGRFPQDVEATVYFCTLEALNNVAKYAGATRATVRLANGNGELRFEVTDDGRGFDTTSTGYGTGLQGMADRLAAVGGELTIRSAPGAGTTIAGTVRA